MQYLQVELNMQPKLTGVKRGGHQAWIDMNSFQGKPEVNDFLYGEGSGFRRGEIPEINLDLLGVSIEPTAKPIDIISVAALLSGYVVNQKVVDILQTCHLPPHKFYNVTFNQNGNIIDGYYWFYFNLLNGEKHLDFTKTVFAIAEEEKRYSRKIIVNNYEDYYAITRDIKRGIGVDKLCFDSSFDCNLDFFGMQFLGSKEYMSVRLKQKFEKHNVTGYYVRTPTDPEVEWHC